MTSLNPSFRVGRQVAEVLERHLDLEQARRRPARGRAARPRSDPGARKTRARISAPALRRHAAARDDRDGARVRSEGARRRRADDGARRDDSGRDPRPHARHSRASRHGDRPDHAQPRRGRRHRRPRAGDVRRPQGGGGAVHDLFARPQHPYTIGLLGAIPRPGGGDHNGRLQEIPGRVPSLDGPWAACAFADRCPRADEQTRSEVPPLREVERTTSSHASIRALP